MRTTAVLFLWIGHTVAFLPQPQPAYNYYKFVHAAVSFNDFSGETIGDDTSEGQELAQEFYEQIRRRQDEEMEKQRQLERLERAIKLASTSHHGPLSQPRRSPQQQQQPPPLVRQDVLDFEKEFRKWTGQDVVEDTQASPSAGLFRGGSSVYSYPSTAAAGAAGGTAISPGNRNPLHHHDVHDNDDDDSLLSHAERAMLSVMPYILALAVVVSLAMGSGAFEAQSNEYNHVVFQPSRSAGMVTTTTMTNNNNNNNAESTHPMEDLLLHRQNNYVML